MIDFGNDAHDPVNVRLLKEGNDVLGADRSRTLTVILYSYLFFLLIDRKDLFAILFSFYVRNPCH